MFLITLIQFRYGRSTNVNGMIAQCFHTLVDWNRYTAVTLLQGALTSHPHNTVKKSPWHVQLSAHMRRWSLCDWTWDEAEKWKISEFTAHYRVNHWVSIILCREKWKSDLWSDFGHRPRDSLYGNTVTLLFIQTQFKDIWFDHLQRLKPQNIKYKFLPLWVLCLISVTKSKYKDVLVFRHSNSKKNLQETTSHFVNICNLILSFLVQTDIYHNWFQNVKKKKKK